MFLCPKIRSCRNSAYCNACIGFNLYSPIKIKSAVKKQNQGRIKGEKQGLEAEKKVVKRYNKVAEIARRTPASGALSQKGDAVTPEMLMEVKERGTLTARGEKQIAIKKDYLTKAEAEAYGSGRFFCLPFKFKGDNRIYAVVDFDDLVFLVEFWAGRLAAE